MQEQNSNWQQLCEHNKKISENDNYKRKPQTKVNPNSQNYKKLANFWVLKILVPKNNTLLYLCRIITNRNL